MKKILFILSLALCSTSTYAASIIATPALKPPSGGSIHCYIANISSTKEIQVKWTIYSFDGVEQFGPTTSTLLPNKNTGSGNSVTTQSTCVVTVLKGLKANLRVSLTAHDSSGNVVAAVQGQ